MAFEKVNPMHPDKCADRIAGAIVDLAYEKVVDPKIAVEVLLGHGKAFVIIETSLREDQIGKKDVDNILRRIVGNGIKSEVIIVPQDINLAANQADGIRAGDNGIFKGVPTTLEQEELTELANFLYMRYRSDGKYLIENIPHKRQVPSRFNPRYWVTICQSKASREDIYTSIRNFENSGYDMHSFIRGTTINPLGEWTGGIDVDSGATNRKLGSDMGDAVTGGGLMGKDLTKADVSVNICCHIMAQDKDQVVTALTEIGDKDVTFRYDDGKKEETLPFSKVVDIARLYINSIGGFEKFAEWGLIRPKKK